MVIARSHPQYNNGRYCLVVEVLNVCEKADVHPRMSFHLNVINCRCSPAIQLVWSFLLGSVGHIKYWSCDIAIRNNKMK